MTATGQPQRLWAPDVAARGLKRDAALEISHHYERLLEDVPLAELEDACVAELERAERYRQVTGTLGDARGRARLVFFGGLLAAVRELQTLGEAAGEG